jgi:membrane-bound serine protease (ClpP class)
MWIGLPLLLLLLFLGIPRAQAISQSPKAPAPIDLAAAPGRVCILPVRDDIMPPMVFLVRRGVKAAMEAKADVLVIDMDTNGGRADVTEEIMTILNQFKGRTVTYVNRRAFSAGAFISVATQQIYMAPQSVIGAAAPIMLSPGGGGVQDLPNTFEAKMTSALSALVRTSAEKNGHNKEVVQAMIDKTAELTIDGKVLNKKGNILTLTNQEAETPYGDPPKPLLSAGTVESLDALLQQLGYGSAQRIQIQPTGVERIATWLTAIGPLLLIAGVVGLYIEFKTPGFGLPGIVGLSAFALYFLGGYVAGLSGLEWVAVFILGLGLVALEFFVFPGTLVLGVAGAAAMILALIMAMVDLYPASASPGLLPAPAWPTMPQLRLPLQNLVIAMLGSVAAVAVLARWLPRTAIYKTVVSHGMSGVATETRLGHQQQAQLGQVGVALSVLRPGGKAQFGDTILDVITQGDLIERGRQVRIVGHSGREAVVEQLG